MTGHHKFNELIKDISPERKAKIEEKTAQLMINLPTQQVQPKETAKIDVRELSGMLYEEGRKAVSLEEMDEAISECAGESA
ncbi:hypothetical protein IQ264_20515 [Phormidium sp. LEGE 05292]|uniref:hypothetical protein n=1 Tax=[Phormidium] sp. LEGE 05292 TaxID=767427 RepID=UPI00187DF22C|nr:hypothetical protein [Phormidium sp. LEGE 05292]MBE9227810.1 hypothetical protein [Phormidium sp. LEGE 05292]